MYFSGYPGPDMLRDFQKDCICLCSEIETVGRVVERLCSGWSFQISRIADKGEQKGAKTDFKSGKADHLREGGGAAKKTDLGLVQAVEVCVRLRNTEKYKSLKINLHATFLPRRFSTLKGIAYILISAIS